MDLLRVVLPNLAMIAATAAIMRWDEARLGHEARTRTWPEATRRIAIVVFAPLSLVIHFGRTRRSVRGVAAGAVWACAVVLLGAAVEALLVSSSRAARDECYVVGRDR